MSQDWTVVFSLSLPQGHFSIVSMRKKLRNSGVLFKADFQQKRTPSTKVQHIQIWVERKIK